MGAPVLCVPRHKQCTLELGTRRRRSDLRCGAVKFVVFEVGRRHGGESRMQAGPSNPPLRREGFELSELAMLK